MTFVSYAQNYEDVALYRALKHISHGFYVDVGAEDPEVDSVTKAFYERGWRGINIEPAENGFRKLCADRPEDVNLNVAAGADSGSLMFFEIADHACLSTAVERIANEHRERGYAVHERSVPVLPLSEILNEHLKTEINFLKIDVEGYEYETLYGLDLSIFRPWIILVESIAPGSLVDSYEPWETLLLKNGYEYCSFDRINRFYVAKEHRELRAALSQPPCPAFDNFITYGEFLNQQKAKELELRNLELKNQISELEHQLNRLP